jgi:hypothetical protein
MHAELVTVAAQHLIDNTKRSTDLFPLVCTSMDDIFDAVARRVEQLSGGKVKIERQKNAEGFPFIIQGPAAYCVRIDTTSGARRRFVLGPYADGIELY